MTDAATSRLSYRLDAVATDSGLFTVLAIDHVRSFATTVRPDDPDSLTPDELRSTKRWLIEGLARHAGAVLVDPGFLTSMSAGWVDTLDGTGLILGIEDGDYQDVLTSPRLLPGWDVERASRLGVDAVKISVYFDPHTGSEAAEQFVADVVAQCEAGEMPLFCEPLALYSTPAERRAAVVEGVRRFGPLGADVLKLQFPESVENPSRQAWAEACEEIDRLQSRSMDHPVGGQRLHPVPRPIGGDVPGRRLRGSWRAGRCGARRPPEQGDLAGGCGPARRTGRDHRFRRCRLAVQRCTARYELTSPPDRRAGRASPPGTTGSTTTSPISGPDRQPAGGLPRGGPVLAGCDKGRAGSGQAPDPGTGGRRQARPLPPDRRLRCGGRRSVTPHARTLAVSEPGRTTPSGRYANGQARYRVRCRTDPRRRLLHAYRG